MKRMKGHALESQHDPRIPEKGTLRNHWRGRGRKLGAFSASESSGTSLFSWSWTGILCRDGESLGCSSVSLFPPLPPLLPLLLVSESFQCKPWEVWALFQRNVFPEQAAKVVDMASYSALPELQTPISKVLYPTHTGSQKFQILPLIGNFQGKKERGWRSCSLLFSACPS